MKKDYHIKNDLISEYKKLTYLLDQVQTVRNKIDLILKSESVSDTNAPKLLGGGKIILINGEFKKVFGLLLKAIQKKTALKNENIYFFSQEEYEKLHKEDKSILMKDTRNIIWEYKNYYTKKNLLLKKDSKDEIKRIPKNKFIKRKFRLFLLNKVKDYIEFYKPISQKIKKISLILEKERVYPFSKNKSSFLPIPKDIRKFYFNNVQKKKFTYKNSTKNWTYLELAFMDLENYFVDYIPGVEEKPGVPYITDSLAENILKGNLNLGKEGLDELKNIVNEFSNKNEKSIIELFSKIEFENLSREDLFVISKLSNIPIFEFGDVLVKEVNFKNVRKLMKASM